MILSPCSAASLFLPMGTAPALESSRVLDWAVVGMALICALALFNLLILAHEAGHWLAARLLGLRVRAFAVWFGRPLWRRNFGETEFRLGWLPIGGYVSLPQMSRSGAAAAGLPAAGAWSRLAVALAGPAASMLFAFGLAWVVWIVGRPGMQGEGSAVVGFVDAGSPASVAGLRAGDEVKSVNGMPVRRFLGVSDSVVWALARATGDTARLVVERPAAMPEETRHAPLTFDVGAMPAAVASPGSVSGGETEQWMRAMRRPGIRSFGIYPATTPVALDVEADSPAARAGLRAGDTLLAACEGEMVPMNLTTSERDALMAGATPLLHPLQLAALLQRAAGEPVTFVVTRIQRGPGDDAHRVYRVCCARATRAGPDGPWRLGVILQPEGVTTTFYPTPARQVTGALVNVGETFAAFWHRATAPAAGSPAAGIGVRQLSGPVGILRLFTRIFTDGDGGRRALWLSVILSVNLAVMNLLPLPVLDGGHALVALVEIGRGRPVSDRFLHVAQTLCFTTLMGALCWLTFFDLLDVLVS